MHPSGEEDLGLEDSERSKHTKNCFLWALKMEEGSREPRKVRASRSLLLAECVLSKFICEIVMATVGVVRRWAFGGGDLVTRVEPS